ncbi:DUF309 domain-containing protein [Bacillus sp. OK048]|uniref:DUF309 domain-containing protein n=1 Tax=Bacillus sp. OK048 TaxID=1882761 RepID=UPI000881582D|nr:DUF309 domain-containing protein [Bacillus sp. OK048]SDM47321.1 hypothetical protein SAMN05443253_103432 [Bacillus sp. OK048]
MYPKAYIQFLAHFHGDRDYFECHEILEEYWKESNERKKNSIWVGFILLAVSRYHQRRKNFIGAKRTLEKAIKILSIQESRPNIQGLDSGSLFPLLSKLLDQINHEESYQSINLQIADPILLDACIKECRSKGFIWGQESDLGDESIVHRHKLRDRTYVTEERIEALKNRKDNR